MVPQKLKDFFLSQLEIWELARNNFQNLEKIEKKPMQAGELKGYIQFNPARAVSTLAKVDDSTISRRKCFLCSHHRPDEQKSMEILPGWELLVNPYPILPYHFTISSKAHTAQRLNIITGKRLAELLDGMVVFYNADGAGASAPDHAHFQAVPIEELPLINLLDRDNIDIRNVEMPFKIIIDPDESENIKEPVNAYFWMDKEKKVHLIAIPRSQHRPGCYYKEPPERRAVSPGAIDMAGVIVTPIKEDFDRLNNDDIEKIYKEVSFCQDEITI